MHSVSGTEPKMGRVLGCTMDGEGQNQLNKVITRKTATVKPRVTQAHRHVVTTEDSKEYSTKLDHCNF